MNRRKCLLTFLGITALSRERSRAAGKPIQLHVDFKVDTHREEELLENYQRIFRPAINRQPGFVDVKLLKFRETLVEQKQADCHYRLVISFQSEEERRQWVATDEHQQAWPAMEGTLTGDPCRVLLYDVV